MNTRHEVVPTAQDQTGQFLIVHAKRNEDWTVTVTSDRYSSVYETRAAWDALYMAFRRGRFPHVPHLPRRRPHQGRPFRGFLHSP